MAGDIPRTKIDFQRMDFMSQKRVKSKLLQQNFSTICESISPETLPKFRLSSIPGDLEELQLSRNRNSKSTVISDLLLRLPRSLKKNPTWWEVLEDVLREHSPELYYAMNPWEERNGHHGGEASDGGGGGGGGGGNPPPSPSVPPGASYPRDGYPGRPGPVAPPGTHAPYHKLTPLAETTGFAAFLAPLCAGGNDVLWRQLADSLGLVLKDQLDIEKRSQGDDIHVLLLRQWVRRYEEGATVECLIRALLMLGQPGLRIVNRMEERQLIQPVEREGSEAGGFVAGMTWDDDREGSTSAEASRAPTPGIPVGNLPSSGRSTSGCPGARLEDPNLSCAQPFKQSLQPAKTGISEPQEDVLERLYRTKSQPATPVSNLQQAPVRRVASVPVSGTDLSDQRHYDYVERCISTDSLVDNNHQPNIANVADPTKEERKIMNSSNPKTVRFPPTGREEEMGGRRSDSATQRSNSLQTDSPSSFPDASTVGHEALREMNEHSSPQLAVADWIRESQQGRENQLRRSTPGNTISAEQLSGLSRANSTEQSTIPREESADQLLSERGGNTTINYNIFFKGKKPIQNVQIGNKVMSTTVLGLREEENDESPDDDLPTPTEVCTERPQHNPEQAEIFREDFSQEHLSEAEMPLSAGPSEYPTEATSVSEPHSSYHPAPWADDEHETAVKQQQISEQEEVETADGQSYSCEEPALTEPDLGDVVDLRANNSADLATAVIHPGLHASDNETQATSSGPVMMTASRQELSSTEGQLTSSEAQALDEAGEDVPCAENSERSLCASEEEVNHYIHQMQEEEGEREREEEHQEAQAAPPRWGLLLSQALVSVKDTLLGLE